ncbi:A/G-specific adenine glycosylase [Kordiimonas sediminis]|uniref:Adenine DNA glycosylase n=1 Tax=Kordiimonas sediminis TaxID=1735581 RepID=A0A919ATH4_9PROT|nr:A/G-specific adenine glycosylase [Kordiimonas sediminis]GHF24805.1 A/G-specific adenine glycosylase [Kordiimonas sediminis]
MNSYGENLLAWYDQHQRTLPWRSPPGAAPDPYHVWLSEIMLQQTTVATVKGYFDKFLRMWPTVDAMAASRQEDILDAWAGLGYYARARNLHKCAQEVVQNHQGQFPRTAADLKTLPGIGDYTSAAIAAIAFGEPVGVVDSNVERIVSRLFRISTPLPKAKKLIQEKTDQITPFDRPGDFAQAMMDLGSSLCSPKNPDCNICPFCSLCQAQTRGDMETFPVKPPKKTKPTRLIIAFAPMHEGSILLERRPDSGLLGGMPGLFSTPWVEQDTHPKDYPAYAPCPGDWTELNGESKHTFTHFHLITRLVSAEVPKRSNVENGFWIKKAELQTLGFPTVFKKMLELLP